VSEADELWRVVGEKGDVWWVWAALGADTRQVVARVAGDRSEATARYLGEALPDEYRDGAVVCTDVLARYRAVVPEDRMRRPARTPG
jgi:IS1 family transposase